MSDAPPPLEISVTGDVSLQEISDAKLGIALARRVMGLWRWLPVSVVACVFFFWGAAAYFMAIHDMPGEAFAGSFGLAVIAATLAWRAMLRKVQREVMVRWQLRGLELSGTVTYSLNEKCLIFSGSNWLTQLNWEGIGELTRISPAYWFFTGGGNVYYMPRRLFSSRGEEVAFLKAMLTRMTPEARTRSAEARKLTAFE